MNYRKLGEMLVQSGLVSSLQLSISLAAQQSSSKRLGEIVVERGFCTEEQIAACLAEQFGYEIHEFSEDEIPGSVLGLIKPDYALDHVVLPVAADEHNVTVAISDPVNVELTDHLDATLKRKITYVIAARTALLERIRKAYQLQEVETATRTEVSLPGRYSNIRPLRDIEGVTVLEALDAELDRKVTLFGGPRGERATHLLRNRVHALSKAPARGICSVYDWFEHEDLCWAVFERVKGETLSHVLRTRGARPLAQATGIVAQIAEGVDTLHQQGSCIGHLCPDNVILSGNNALLVPLGESKRGYQAPEFESGAGATQAGDIFALGTLLWECLSGHNPHLIGNEIAWADPRQFQSELPVAMIEVLSKALASDPNERYSSAILLANNLRSYNWSVVTPSAGEAAPTNEDRQHLLAIMASDQTSSPKASFWQRLFGKAA